MNIQKCFLDVENDISLPKGILSQQLRETGRSHIWEERVVSIDTVVIHYMSAIELKVDAPFSLEECLQILVDFDVSSHYIIDRSGMIFYLVPESCKAWHSGGSIMPAPDNREGVNDFSIGIELLATKDSGFTASQYESLFHLCGEVESRHSIKNYTGHENIAGKRAVELGLRGDEKIDPGIYFDWSRIDRIPIV